jgi:hypothetical protein
MEVKDEKLESLSTANAGDSPSVGDALPRIDKDKPNEPPGLEESSYSGGGGYSGSGANSSAGAYSGSSADAFDAVRKKKPAYRMMVSVQTCGQPRSSIVTAIHSQYTCPLTLFVSSLLACYTNIFRNQDKSQCRRCKRDEGGAYFNKSALSIFRKCSSSEKVRCSPR